MAASASRNHTVAPCLLFFLGLLALLAAVSAAGSSSSVMKEPEAAEKAGDASPSSSLNRYFIHCHMRRPRTDPECIRVCGPPYVAPPSYYAFTAKAKSPAAENDRKVAEDCCCCPKGYECLY